MTPKQGRNTIPALAYTAIDAASPVDALLVFRSNKSRTKATLCLLIDLQDSETIVFQYDADNLVSGSLQPATTNLPQSRLARITPSGAPLHTLSMRLKAACPIWGPQSGSITLKDDYDVTIRQLATVAKATELYIVFDLQCLNKVLHTIFRHFVAHPDQLAGFPVARFYEDRGLAHLDASIFDTTPGSDEDTASDAMVEYEPPPMDEDEDLPPYEPKSLKRPREASSSPTSKRLFLSDLEYVAPSSTEKTRTPVISPKPPYNRTASALDIQHAVDTAVSRLLSSVLTVALLTVRQTASPRTSPASSPRSLPAPSSSPSLLSKTLGEGTARRSGKELGKFFARILSESSQQHTEAYEKFSEELQERLLDLDVMKDEIITELNCVSADELDSLKQDCEAVTDNVSDGFEHKLYMLSDAAIDKINAAKRQEADLVPEKKLLAREQELLAVDRTILDRKEELFELEKKAREQQLLAVDRMILDRKKELIELEQKVHDEQRRLRSVRDTAQRGGRAGSAPA